MEINIPRFVSSVLPPTKVDQASIPEKDQFHVFPHFVCFSNLVKVLRRDCNIPNWYTGLHSKVIQPGKHTRAVCGVQLKTIIVQYARLASTRSSIVQVN